MNRTLARLNRQIATSTKTVDPVGQLGFDPSGLVGDPEYPGEVIKESAIKYAAHNRWSKGLYDSGLLLTLDDEIDPNIRSNLLRKREYGSSAENLYGKDSDRVSFHICPKDSISSPIKTFDQIIVQNIAEGTREKVQLLPSSVGNKLYSFGTELDMITIQARLIDTQIGTKLRSGDQVYDGAGMRNWQEFYALGKISECAKLNQIVVMTHAGKTVQGAFVQYSAQFSAVQPHLVDLSITFIVKDSKPKDQ